MIVFMIATFQAKEDCLPDGTSQECLLELRACNNWQLILVSLGLDITEMAKVN